MLSNILFSLMTNNNTSPIFIFSSRYIQTYTHIHTCTCTHTYTHTFNHSFSGIKKVQWFTHWSTSTIIHLFIFSHFFTKIKTTSPTKSNITSTETSQVKPMMKTLPICFVSFSQSKIFINIWIEICKDYWFIENKPDHLISIMSKIL